jgi:hypothetical protein
MKLRVNLDTWWSTHQPKYYRELKLKFSIKLTEELTALDRPPLYRLLAVRTRYGDFAAYYRRFKHEDAELKCICGRYRLPTYIFFCKRTTSGKPKMRET